MTVESGPEDDWVLHELASHEHDEQVILWDEALDNSWSAELRCTKCAAVRFLQRNEAISRIAAKHFRRHEGKDIYWLRDGVRSVGTHYGEGRGY